MSAPSEDRPQLDELMMAMDVVDTLRHDRMALERELGQDDRDETLKRRLRKIYEGQGLEVTDAILEEGIAALRESRFVYEPPKPSIAVTLAKVWVSRMRWGPWAGGAAALLLLWIGWGLVAGTEADRLADRLNRVSAQAEALAATNAASAEVAGLRGQVEAALAADRFEEAETGLGRLEARVADLGLAFEVRIVSRPGEPTGVFRVPDVNTGARNYYILVEAVDPDGRVIARPVTNEETGRTEEVTIWAIRVPEATYRMVERDKRDDGIVQNAVLGIKPVGDLAVDWRLPVMDGAITEWDR